MSHSSLEAAPESDPEATPSRMQPFSAEVCILLAAPGRPGVACLGLRQVTLISPCGRQVTGTEPGPLLLALHSVPPPVPSLKSLPHSLGTTGPPKSPDSQGFVGWWDEGKTALPSPPPAPVTTVTSSRSQGGRWDPCHLWSAQRSGS